MARILKSIALAAVILTVLFAALYRGCGVSIAFAITFGTTAYHLCMRLVVGAIYDTLLHNRVDPDKKWFQEKAWEPGLYKKLGVKAWKSRMPTYDTNAFDPKYRSWDQIAQAMCQSELVHETIMVFSFLPLFAAIPFGALPVFLITSVLAAGYDLLFVILQRYNRPRIRKLLNRSSNR